jgi:hypothetical protein
MNKRVYRRAPGFEWESLGDLILRDRWRRLEPDLFLKCQERLGVDAEIY